MNYQETIVAGRRAPGPAPASRPKALIAVLGALTAVASLATDMYVPGLPQMTSALHISAAGAQLSITAVLVGMAAGQVLIGPVSDGVGRRAPLIAGSAGFVVFSLACAFAPDLWVLLAARLLQGASGAAGMVLARAVITDRFHGRDIPKYFALLAQILGISPIAAPLIGGAVLSFADWRAIFIVLGVLGAAFLAGILAFVPESLPEAARHPQGLAGSFREMGSLLRHRGFLGFTLVLGLCSACLFAYIGGSAFVFENLHHVSAQMYSLIFAVNAVGALVGGASFGALAHKVRLNTLLVVSVAVAAAGTVLNVALTLGLGETLGGSWVSLLITMAGVGMLIPASLSLGQGVGRRAPGSASAALGGAQFTFGAAAAPLVGVISASGSLPMGLVMLCSMALAVLATIFLVQPGRGHGETDPAAAH